MGMSKPSRVPGGLRGGVSAPAGYGAAPRSKTHVSKYFHGFFITINSMILYFKHIIHIDDFPLNGHPPSLTLWLTSTQSHDSATHSDDYETNILIGTPRTQGDWLN